MRLKIGSWLVAAGAVCLGGFANAQPEGPTAEQPQRPELAAQADVQLTPQQMLQKANDHIARMDQGARGVRQQLTEARQERDVVKVLCLNDKLNQIDVALASANDRVKSLESMVKSNDADRAKHEFTIISVLRERVETLLAEANQCVGEELGYVGNTEVNVNIDPGIPDTDPSGFPDEPVFGGGPTTIISAPRPPASPG